MPNKLLIKSKKYSEAFLPERKGDASHQMNLACKSPFHKIADEHFHHHFVVFRVLLAWLKICCRCALIPPFSVTPLMMNICPVIGTVTHVDVIYSADGRTAQATGKALEVTGENPCGSLCFGLVFLFVCRFFSFELWLMAVSDITNGRMRFVNTPALTSGQSGREKDRFLLFLWLSSRLLLQCHRHLITVFLS